MPENEVLNVGDSVKTVDGRGPVMLVRQLIPFPESPSLVLVQWWRDEAMQVLPINRALLCRCPPYVEPSSRDTLLERLASVVTLVVEATDLWAAVQSGRAEVVSLDGSPAPADAVAVKPDEPPTDMGESFRNSCLQLERELWKEVFADDVPASAFSACATPGERASFVANRLAMVRSDDPDLRSSFIDDLMTLLDFALRCGHETNRAYAVAEFNRVLDERSERRRRCSPVPPAKPAVGESYGISDLVEAVFGVGTTALGLRERARLGNEPLRDMVVCEVSGAISRNVLSASAKRAAVENIVAWCSERDAGFTG